MEYKILPKPLLFGIFLIFSSGFFLHAYSQDVKYDPKGNPEKWNVEITPFLILPWVSGDIQSQKLSQEFGIGPSGFINTLNFTFMIQAEVSKDKFFAASSYLYNYNEVEKVIWISGGGNQSITFNPKYQRHIFELIAGMRLRLASQFYMDPYAGFRYTHYRLFGTLETITDTGKIEEQADFWDPVIGFRAHYYPHPRVPVELKADIGGFGAGSDLTWSLWVNSGYTISPTVDIIGGFGSLYNRYKFETGSGFDWKIESLTYGMTFGVRIYLPKRYKDPAVFKKAKQE